MAAQDESRGLRPRQVALVSPAGSGAVCQWQTFSTDRSGNGDRCWTVPTGHQHRSLTLRSLQWVDRALARFLLFLQNGSCLHAVSLRRTTPPLPQARGRLVPCGHAPALAAGKRAACPVRPRTRPCRRQEGGLSRAATHPPLPQARRRLVPCGHAPALAAGKRAACPVRPRTRPCRRQEGGLSRAATHPPLPQARGRLVPCGHAPALAAGKRAACPVRPRTRPCRRQEGGLSCGATRREREGATHTARAYASGLERESSRAVTHRPRAWWR